MALVYFDASALVKLVVEEPGSDVAGQLWDACDAAFSSRLAYAEVRAALSAARRSKSLSPRQAKQAEADWEEFWASTRPVELTRAVEREAGELASSHALRGADAVHLASALTLSPEHVVVAVWDKRLHTGARSIGLRVAPAALA